MSLVNESYGRDFDLNLLGVFIVVADTGSVTRAAASLYLTQPAVSAALRRLATRSARSYSSATRAACRSRAAAPSCSRSHGRMCARGSRRSRRRSFDAKTSDRTWRLSSDGWLLPPLLRARRGNAKIRAIATQRAAQLRRELRDKWARA